MVVSCPGRSRGSLHGTGGWGSGVRRQPDATCQGTGSEGVRALELLLESGAGAPYPPRGRLQLLPSAQAWKAQPALPSGERQGDLVPEREREETGERERRGGLARSWSRGRLGSGSGPFRGWPGVWRGRPAGWAAVLTGQWPGLVVQGLGQVLNSEIMLVT